MGTETSFTIQRQHTLNALQQAVGGQSQACCAPINGFGMFGWFFEGQSGASDAMQGNLRYGLAYLGHMIDQGFETAFAVVQGSQPPLVCLKTWEPGEAEPPWPAQTWSLIHHHEQEHRHGF
ncbi:MAG: hypothetical protein LBE30_14110 [Comamonas sp.]|jgi:hypothetical protein|nr:hypothetical protein [Comamonas sp.]